MNEHTSEAFTESFTDSLLSRLVNHYQIPQQACHQHQAVEFWRMITSTESRAFLLKPSLNGTYHRHAQTSNCIHNAMFLSWWQLLKKSNGCSSKSCELCQEQHNPDIVTDNVNGSWCYQWWSVRRQSNNSHQVPRPIQPAKVKGSKLILLSIVTIIKGCGIPSNLQHWHTTKWWSFVTGRPIIAQTILSL